MYSERRNETGGSVRKNYEPVRKDAFYRSASFRLNRLYNKPFHRKLYTSENWNEL